MNAKPSIIIDAARAQKAKAWRVAGICGGAKPPEDWRTPRRWRGALEQTADPVPMAAVSNCAATRKAAFTLIELLVVIAVMAILAAMIFPVTGAINRNKIRSKARAELGLLQMAIENYKTELGHYPPDNPVRAGYPYDPRINQLFFELKGARLTNGVYQALDGSAQVRANSISNAFPNGFGPGVGGIANCTSGASGDEGRRAMAGLSGLKADQVGGWDNNQDNFKLLACPVPGPVLYPTGNPLAGQTLFAYNSSNPTNNPGSFDLWVDVLVSGKTNRISNWSKEPLIVYQN